jgi:hypothetical protein
VIHKLPIISEGLTNITSLYVIYPVMRIIQGLFPGIDLAYIIYLNVLYYAYNVSYHILNGVLKLPPSSLRLAERVVNTLLK